MPPSPLSVTTLPAILGIFLAEKCERTIGGMTYG